MVVSFNPQIKVDSALTFKQNSNASDSTSATAEPVPKKLTANKVAANVAYGWVNISEGAKGTVRAVVSAFVVGTAIAGYDYARSLFKKQDGISFFKKLFNPKKVQLGKVGKYVAPAAAAVVLVANVILTRFKINQRTANVDHALYEGHRDK